ncbi:MAG: 50S ribosome-binding GTPase, partial [Planctomycetales bacterium]|nr:50S ribosome-binding GTPase [Planctomycetales bacterium]
AGLDFADEDLQFIAPEAVLQSLAKAHDGVRDLRRQLAERRQRPPAPRVVLAGPPNAGKSSLFNALVARYGEAGQSVSALVADVPGTTRDYVATRLQIGGVECELVDTAGIEDVLPEEAHASEGARDQVEGAIDLASHRRSFELLHSAELVVLCRAVDQVWRDWPTEAQSVLHVLSKCDLLGDEATSNSVQAALQISVSSATGQGIDQLAEQMRAALARLVPEASLAVGAAATAQRCSGSLQLAAEAILAAQRVAAAREGDELLAGEIRIALDALGEVAGAVDADDVLDRIFSQFCIGK